MSDSGRLDARSSSECPAEDACSSRLLRCCCPVGPPLRHPKRWRRRLSWGAVHRTRPRRPRQLHGSDGSSGRRVRRVARPCWTCEDACCSRLLRCCCPVGVPLRHPKRWRRRGVVLARLLLRCCCPVGVPLRHPKRWRRRRCLGAVHRPALDVRGSSTGATGPPVAAFVVLPGLVGRARTLVVRGCCVAAVRSEFLSVIRSVGGGVGWCLRGCCCVAAVLLEFLSVIRSVGGARLGWWCGTTPP